MKLDELKKQITFHLKKTFPDMEIRVEPDKKNTSKTAIYFIDKRFKDLYQMQRYHLLFHALPNSFIDNELKDTLWFELAPGEDPTSLQWSDEKVINSIKKDILNILYESDFFDVLEERLCPTEENEPHENCLNDFRFSKSIFNDMGLSEEQMYYIFHVLMDKGAFCDCEILYNV